MHLSCRPSTLKIISTYSRPYHQWLNEEYSECARVVLARTRVVSPRYREKSWRSRCCIIHPQSMPHILAGWQCDQIWKLKPHPLTTSYYPLLSKLFQQVKFFTHPSGHHLSWQRQQKKENETRGEANLIFFGHQKAIKPSDAYFSRNVDLGFKLWFRGTIPSFRHLLPVSYPDVTYRIRLPQLGTDTSSPGGIYIVLLLAFLHQKSYGCILWHQVCSKDNVKVLRGEATPKDWPQQPPLQLHTSIHSGHCCAFLSI